MEKGRESGTSSAAYPTCSIRRSDEAFENTNDFSRALPIPQSTCKIESIHLLIFTKG